MLLSRTVLRAPALRSQPVLHRLWTARAPAGPLSLRSAFRQFGNAPNKDPSELGRQLRAEFDKLSKLQKKFQAAGLFEKIAMASQMVSQLQLVRQIRDEVDRLPLVLPVADPLDPKVAARYRTAYSFMLDRFLLETDRQKSDGTFKENLASDIIRDFSDKHPHLTPLLALELEATFTAYYRLVALKMFVEDVEFSDPRATELFALFHTNSTPAVADEDTVQAWKEIHDVFMSVPFDEASSTEALNPLDITTELLPFIPPPGFQLKPDAKTGSAASKATPPGSKPGSPDGKKPKPLKYSSKFFDIEIDGFSWSRVLLILSPLVLLIWYLRDLPRDEITFQEFTSDYLRKNLARKIRVVNNRTAYVELNDTAGNRSPDSPRGDIIFTIGDIEAFERGLKAVQDELNVPDALRVSVVYEIEGQMTKLLYNLLPTLMFLGAIYFISKNASLGARGGPFGFGKSTAKKFNQEKDIKIKFKDVAGMNEAKEEVMEFVKFLKNPSKYEKLGAKIPRGAILSGPPGTGKTLIAKATAGEAGVPFFSVSGSEFVEMFVGVGASRVRDLFKTARENAPSIVFVDEIDAIGKQRSKGNSSGANDERETTLNQLLVEMDGFETSDHVVVLAGTNRADILDKALMRPGRFDRHIAIDNPELQGRKEIFDVHLKKIKLVENIDKDLSGRLAALTPGFSGADIANVCNESALIAARFNAKAVTLRHFELAIERVIGGVEKKTKLLSPEEKRIVAYHEAGHAVCGWFLKHAHPLLKVSIIPRGQGALGYAQYLPPDQYLMSEVQLQDRMVMTLGGRVSEELNFKSVTSGAYDDFKKVTSLAQAMVMRFGMSPRVGMVNYADTQGQDKLTKPFSDSTNQVIDGEIKRIVQECHDRCKALLTEKAAAVELVAQELLRKEFITREDMINLLGKRPFPETNDAFDKYLDGKDAFKNEKPADERKDDE